MSNISVAVQKIFYALVLGFLSTSLLAASPHNEQWRKVEDAIKEGLPKTAITNLEPIIKATLAEKNYPEAVKAIARKIVLEGNIEGNKPEEKIFRLEKELTTAPAEIKPIFETILAHWYWQYFQQNRWRFMQRTQTATAPGKDFTTWDLPRIMAEIDKHFSLALASEKILKATPVSAYDALLEKGTMPDAYRPTLYDFIAHEALSFYTAGEQAGAKVEDAFEVSADSEIFSDAEKFISWEPHRASGVSPEDSASETPAARTNSPTFKAIQLFQALLKFRWENHDKMPVALLNDDLERLVFGYNVAVGENKNSHCKAALKAFAEKWADRELSAQALYHLAGIFQREGDLVEAHKIARLGKKRFPKSAGGKLCHNLILQIEMKSAQIFTERVWNTSETRGHDGRATNQISVHYKNLGKVFFRAIPRNWESFLGKKHNRPESLSDKERDEILKVEPARQWSADLPPTLDFKERLEKIPAPENLPAGFYFVIASHDPDFAKKNNQISMTDVWVSDLALVLRSGTGVSPVRSNEKETHRQDARATRQLEGFVLDARSGEPLPGAKVEAWYLNNQGERIALPSVQSDENGFFNFPQRENERDYVVRVKHNGQQIASAGENYWWWYDHRDERVEDQTIFFTDRAIYRPCQTIQFKGICLHLDQQKDNYDVLPGREVVVGFFDANDKEISRQQFRCNDYGSFAGSFTSPRDRVMGQMQLRVVGGPNGYTAFRIEEYKRPKFQVTLDAPKIAAKLGEKLVVTGHAMNYTGAAVDGAPVKFRVVRDVRMPDWFGWFGWRHRFSRSWSSNQEIDHGSVKTETDGTFNIEFVAKPDSAVPEKDEPKFVFEIYADVTDSAGETRSANRDITLGYTTFDAKITAENWQTENAPIELKIATTTLDGEPQAAEGSVKIYALKSPPKVQRPALRNPYYWRGEEGEPEEKDLSDPNNWELGEVVAEKGFGTEKDGKGRVEFKLAAGVFRAKLKTQDRFGKKVSSWLPLQVLQPDAKKLSVKIPHLLSLKKDSLEPGEELLALWGTGYDEGRAFIEIEHRGKMIERFWTKPGQTQQEITMTVTEKLRGGFTLHVTQVRENRGYFTSRRIDVPWSNKELELKWEHFTSKLEPKQKETWTAVISKVLPASRRQNSRETPEALKVAAEMVATLYDASLEAFMPHQWAQRFWIFRQDSSTLHSTFGNEEKIFQHAFGGWNIPWQSVEITFRHFPPDLVQNFYGYEFSRRKGGVATRFETFSGIGALGGTAPGFEMEAAKMPASAMAAPVTAPMDSLAKQESNFGVRYANKNLSDEGKGAGKVADLNKVAARKNLNETAFFFPQLVSDSNGVVRMTFTMPEALTEWKFIGFAHDTKVRSGLLEGKTVTAKELMVQPNPPRFLREGDTLEFTVKVSNQSDKKQSGKVRLTFESVLPTLRREGESSGETPEARSADKLLGNKSPEQSFEIPAKESRSFSWRISVPDGLTTLSYKAVGATEKTSDGEEGFLPVLSRRVLVTESLPLPIRGPAQKKFEFKKLLESSKSKTLRNQSLTVQMVSNPSWYAVLALPYLMEFPHECTEQTFNRFYANSLARHIAGSDPKIHKVFEQWRNTPALESPLEKNQDLKSVALLETPWVRQAESESQARRNVGILFDDNRLEYEAKNTSEKLQQMQLNDGSWPWFPGGHGNDYITLYITTGFGRMRHLGLDLNMEPAIRSLNRLDGWIEETYREILRRYNPKDNHLTPTIALYLYGRSFFLQDKPIAPEHLEAVDYFLGQARKFWLELINRQSQAHLALALKRFDFKQPTGTPEAIMKSIRERSVTNEEMGMFWRDTEMSWWWYRAPIETQALMIEAFDEVMNDASAVEECKVWLLKQKQTQDWKTTKATADAVYALLLRGGNNLASDTLVEVSLGGDLIKPEKTEAGTGFYEKKFSASEIKPSLGKISVKKTDQGVAWGSVHWQYLEDISKVTPHEGTPLKLKKSLFVKTNTDRGPTLVPFSVLPTARRQGKTAGETPAARALAVGDELVVRIELRVDRDMEYVHLKDQRGSGLEPLNVLSQYRYQDGLAYYESTRDTASHFFIDYLPKGVYVFEYSTRVQHRGDYQSGLAEIQCMYAPEFNSHSESFELRVK